jgi:hypothetical protein
MNSSHADLQKLLLEARANAAHYAEKVSDLSAQIETVLRRKTLARDAIRMHEAETHAEAHQLEQSFEAVGSHR